MRILITGNMGYVGPVVARVLRSAVPGCELIGYDTGFFGHCLTHATTVPEVRYLRQHFGDVRDFPPDLLRGVDSVVHLAAISNDPMGSKFETVTEDINQASSLRLAELARDARVGSFVFASSCSIYGFAEGGARRESDPTNPLTAYARSKIGTEQALKAMDLGPMTVTSLRFATACGMSERLRLDLVLNDFVACALASGEITILSDGTPWRPLIDVEDMGRAIAWAIERPASRSGRFLAVNVGHDGWNFQVRDLAEAVARAVPGTRVSINKDAQPDRRSYKVDFSLFREIAPDHIPRLKLEDSILRLRDGLTAMGFADRSFRSSIYMRLRMLERHIAEGRLGPDLRWRKM
jgi:nucleoside-diphosphate-sugar epimerase